MIDTGLGPTLPGLPDRAPLKSYTLGTGTAPTLLLHGFLGSARNLSGLARAWSEADPSRRFLLVDLPGHGGSGPVAPDEDYTSTADRVLETLHALGVDGPVDVLGHSAGGRVGLAVLARAPHRIRSVTLLDISPSPIGEAGRTHTQVIDVLARQPDRPTSRDEVRQSLLSQRIAPPTVEWLLTNLASDGDAYRWRIDRAGLQSARPRFNATDLWPVARAYPGALRVLYGTRSPYVDEADRLRLRALGIPVEPIEAGHDIHAEALRELVARLTGSGA